MAFRTHGDFSGEGKVVKIGQEKMEVFNGLEILYWRLLYRIASPQEKELAQRTFLAVVAVGKTIEYCVFPFLTLFRMSFCGSGHNFFWRIQVVFLSSLNVQYHVNRFRKFQGFETFDPDLAHCSQCTLSLPPENRKVFWCFQGVEKGCIGNEWIKSKRLKVKDLVIVILSLFLDFLLALFKMMKPFGYTSVWAIIGLANNWLIVSKSGKSCIK